MPPEVLEKPAPPPPPRSCLPIALALMGGSTFVILLCFLTLGWLAPVVVLVGLAAGFFALQYFIWGRWLEKIVREQAEREQDEPPPSPGA